ncbi:rCG56179 [Rattus norvegicus]|uniref:RCG56179 n=1 Tax=Rattus norvegicus TaxID=10116 RepID=A6IB98_RAT|nr:rCG56179 [Rattus norvegicus]
MTSSPQCSLSDIAGAMSRPRSTNSWNQSMWNQSMWNQMSVNSKTVK